MSNNGEVEEFVANNLERFEAIGGFVDGTILTVGEYTLIATASLKLECDRHATFVFRLEVVEGQVQGTLDTVLCSNQDTFRARYGTETAIGRSLLNHVNPNVVIPVQEDNVVEAKSLAFQALVELAIMRTKKINEIVNEYNKDTESINRAIETVEETTAEQLGEILH